MPRFIRILAAMAVALGAVAPVVAQQSEGESAAPPADAQTQPEMYVAAEHGDWVMRCLRTDQPFDPCQLYQLMSDEEGNPVSEITLFLLEENPRAVLGATIGTPLETLLNRQIGLSVDGGVARRYPFTYCSVQGCYSRVGFTAEEVEIFRKGNNATISIVPLASPDTVVELNLSLKGFTAGHNALLALRDQRNGN